MQRQNTGQDITKKRNKTGQQRKKSKTGTAYTKTNEAKEIMEPLPKLM